MENTETKTQLTAAQRLMGLEDAVRYIDATLGNLSRTLDMQKDLMEEFYNRIRAVEAVLVTTGAVSKEAVENQVQSLRAEKLKSAVAELAQSGMIKKVEEVSQRSLLIGREVNKDGTVVTKHAQFWVESLKPEVSETMLGKKVGDLLFDDSDVKFEVSEIYDFVPQTEKSEETAQVQ